MHINIKLKKDGIDHKRDFELMEEIRKDMLVETLKLKRNRTNTNKGISILTKSKERQRTFKQRKITPYKNLKQNRNKPYK